MAALQYITVHSEYIKSWSFTSSNKRKKKSISIVSHERNDEEISITWREYAVTTN